ncbi:FAP10B [Auxenochlorella protothecoides x Auxenochlorella symbiontica]
MRGRNEDVDLETLRPTHVSGAGPFDMSCEALFALNENKSDADMARAGGLAGVASALRTELHQGCNLEGPTGLAARREAYGSNVFKPVPAKNFFVLWYSVLKDPTLIMLMAAALVSTIIGTAVKAERDDQAYTEGIAIWVAVLVVSLVGAGNDWQKDRQFQKLNSQRDVIEVKVLRGGAQATCLNSEVVVGDVLCLDTGDKIVADGYMIDGHGLVVDEASLTGEAEPIKKGERDPWMRSGTQVTEGSGRMLVLAVGEQSDWGRTMSMVQVESPDTPLQEKLGVLATAIGKLGLVVAVICFFVLLIRWMVENRGFPLSQFASGPLEFFIFAVTIVVVAVPEGLPLAVTISLAYSMGKMLKDNNFVRVLAACETMGGATAICSDKTGTLTENRMTVVDGWFAGAATKGLPLLQDLGSGVGEAIVDNISLNSKAFLVEGEHGGVDFVGNRTECALLMLARGWERDYRDVRAALSDDVAMVFNFSSERKMSSVLLRGGAGGGLRLLCKGAAEVVLGRCSRVAGGAGGAGPLGADLRRELEECVTAMATRGLRTLCLAMADVPVPKGALEDAWSEPPERDMTLLCIVGIKDPVRQEVPEAVATCQRAGIVVRMVTGDNIHTACHIARECGILTPDGVAMEGPEFRNMDEQELLQLLPRLQVLARSSPTDKHTLVRTLKRLGEVVAVTGDGTNDAPALKESDVGLAMGIAGTEVAKEAADIIILDDNFSSIVKSVLWGRSVFSNIRKFLQFQLTINLVALTVAFIAAVSKGEQPLNVLQLLWVNLIMDSLAALALATENPTPDLLLERPHGRNESLINKTMAKHIVVQALYQCFWLFLIFYGMPAQLPAFAIPSQCDYYQAQTTLCCEAGSAACLQSGGGMYLPGETPICVTYPEGGCTITEPSQTGFCSGEETGCSRYTSMQSAYDAAESGFTSTEETAKRLTNSMVFNTFIFLQLFNEINSRKIRDELNVFKGFLSSIVFTVVLALTVGFQVIIMFFLNGIFKTTRLSGLEWALSIIIGSSVLLVSLLTKLISRRFFPPQEPTEEEEEERRRSFHAPEDLYRLHWWQWLRPPPPAHVKSAWKEQKQEAKAARRRQRSGNAQVAVMTA